MSIKGGINNCSVVQGLFSDNLFYERLALLDETTMQFNDEAHWHGDCTTMDADGNVKQVQPARPYKEHEELRSSLSVCSIKRGLNYGAKIEKDWA